MRSILREDIHKRIHFENSWWDTGEIPYPLSWKPRRYIEQFQVILNSKVNRAILLMGPRRVGKTVLIHHIIRDLIHSGIKPKNICYFSIDHPVFNRLRLDELISHYSKINNIELFVDDTFIFFDEIQYLKDWENHLKILVDDYPKVKFVASGSAAAALKLKSQESGAGRFTEFLLPPLTFYEFIDQIDKHEYFTGEKFQQSIFQDHSINDYSNINKYFLEYINFGGYPEVVHNPVIKGDPQRYIKSDIVDKVLLRDLPTLYGVGDIQELNSLFTTLAFNTGKEVSLQDLSQDSGVAKNTIKKYIEYLEAAFLIKLITRVDQNSKTFKRVNTFKIYLTNSSLRAALFAPIENEKDHSIGSVVETAVYSQFFHGPGEHHYYRDKKGEIDLIGLDTELKPINIVEIKWSDNILDTSKLKTIIEFCHKHNINQATLTSKSRITRKTIENVTINIVPSSLYSYVIGKQIIETKHEVYKEVFSFIDNFNLEET